MTFAKHFTLLLFCLAVSAVTVAQPSVEEPDEATGGGQYIKVIVTRLLLV
jgi:hypothetical protein